MSLGYVLRLVDTGLAGLLVGLCVLRFHRDFENRARNARIAGLGLICLAVAWGSFYRRNDDFRPWLPFLTVGLLLSVWGMRRPASGEPFFKGIRK